MPVPVVVPPAPAASIGPSPPDDEPQPAAAIIVAVNANMRPYLTAVIESPFLASKGRRRRSAAFAIFALAAARAAHGQQSDQHQQRREQASRHSAAGATTTAAAFVGWRRGRGWLGRRRLTRRYGRTRVADSELAVDIAVAARHGAAPRHAGAAEVVRRDGSGQRERLAVGGVVAFHGELVTGHLHDQLGVVSENAGQDLGVVEGRADAVVDPEQLEQARRRRLGRAPEAQRVAGLRARIVLDKMSDF